MNLQILKTLLLLLLLQPLSAQTSAQVELGGIDQSIQSAHLRVHPPVVQPYKPNQFTFVVENIGSVAAEEVALEIAVPETAKILAVLPGSSVVTDQLTRVSFGKLSPSERVQVHLTANNEDTKPIRFQVRIANATELEFDPTLMDGAAVKDVADGWVPVLQASQPIEGIQKIPAREGFKPNPFYAVAFPESSVPIVQPNFTKQSQSVPAILPNSETNYPTTEQNSFPANQQSPSDGWVEPIMEMYPEDSESDVEFSPETNSLESEEPLLIEPTPIPQTIKVLDSELLSLRIKGNQDLEQGNSSTFELVLKNSGATDLNNAFVRITIPDGMVIEEFDRETWYDEATGDVSFRVQSIPNGDSEVVTYRLKGVQKGFQIQKIFAEADGVTAVQQRFDTLIR